MSRITRAMTETEDRMKDMALSKTPQQVADTASEWVGALAAFLTAMRRVRNYVASPDKDFTRAKVVQEAIALSATTLEGMASEEGDFLLRDLDQIVWTLDTQHPAYKRVEALRSELYRLMSEAKVVMAANVVAD